MKKILLVMLCMVLLVGTISALEFTTLDDVKIYNKDLSVYTLKEFFGLGKTISTLERKTPQNYEVGLGYQKVAEIEIRNGEYDYDEIINGIKLYNIKDDMKEVIRDVDYKYLIYEEVIVNDYGNVCNKVLENGTKVCSYEVTGTRTEQKEVWKDFTKNSLLKGEVITLGLFTDVQKGDKIEWVLNVYGNERLKKWAIWTESLEVDLTIYYKMDETTGTNFKDELPKFGNATGINTDNDDWIGGIINNGHRFNGVDESVDLPGGQLIPTGTNAFSVSMWVNFTNVGDYQAMVILAQDSQLVISYHDADDRLLSGFRGVNDGGAVWTWTDADFEDKGELMHLVWVYEGGVKTTLSNYNLYINGSLFTTGKAGVGSGLGGSGTYNSLCADGDGTTNFLGGLMDEVGIWNRSLSADEASDLWNEGNGLPYRGKDLEVVLNSPINYYNSTNQTIVFNASVTAKEGSVENVTLYINEVANETNSSGINGTYIFTKTLSDGDYNWSILAFNNESNSAQSGTRYLTVNTTPFIQFEDPTPINYYNSTSSYIPVNVSLTETYFKNITFSFYDDTLTEFYYEDSTRFINESFADGDYSYNVTTCTTTNQCNSTETRNLSLDINLPFINITYPPTTIDHHLLNTNLSLNWTVSDINLDSCWYDYNTTNISVTCSDNHTNINITDYNNRNITFWANDTFGHYNSSYITWDYTVFENSQEFTNETLEGTIETFTANVTVDESNPITISNFIYNGISHIDSFSQSGNDTILTIDFIILDVNTDSNLTFYWFLTLLDGQTINLTSHNQTIVTLSLDDCSVNTIVLYNYTIVDEGNQSLLSNTTAELNLNLLDAERENYIVNFSKKYLETNPFAVCINKNISSSTYASDSIVKYEATGYAVEYYNIVNAIITNSTIPIEITLYDLFSSDSTEFKITFKAEDFTFVEGALIYIDRQYISENNTFKTVELPKTDSNGQTVGHFVRNDVVYNIRVIKDGVVLGNFKNIIAFCEDYLVGNCQMVLEATPEEITTFDYDEQLGIIFQSVPTYNENTSAVSFDFSTNDGTVKTVYMEVTRDDIFGNRSICNNSLTSSSGTLSCLVPDIDDSVLRVEIYVEGQPIVFSNVKLEASDYGNLGYVLWFFLTFLFILIFGSSKTEVLIGLIASFIGAIALGITRGNIIGLGSAGIWVLVITILGIWKLNKENPQT